MLLCRCKGCWLLRAAAAGCDEKVDGGAMQLPLAASAAV
jgi:hypothetical protein